MSFGTQSRRRWLRTTVVFAIVALGFGLRLWFALKITPRQVSDARTYSNMALAFVAGEGYQAAGLPSAYIPIGYPLALAGVGRLFGTDPGVARIANAVFALGTLLGLFTIARALTHSRLAATLTLLLFALYPADIGFTSSTLSQAFLNAVGLTGCALCLYRQRPHAAALVAGGGLLGLATLTRHQGAVFPLLIAGAWLLQPKRRRRATDAAWMLAAFIVTLTPWTIRNAYALNAFVPIATNGGINMYIGNNPHANGRYRITREIDALRKMIPEPRRGGPNEVWLDRTATHLAVKWASERPRDALKLWPRKLRALYVGDEGFTQWLHKLPRPKQHERVERLQALGELYYPPMLWLGALGACIAALELISGRRRMHSLLWMPAGVVVAFTALHMLAFGSSSYHHPIMPWIAIYAGYALSAPWRL